MNKEFIDHPLFSDANLVSYWRLNGNSNDSKGSNHGSDTAITYSVANGKFVQGAGFNGTSSYISFGTTSSLKATNFAISIWFKTSNHGTFRNLWQSGENETATSVWVLIMNDETILASLGNTINTQTTNTFSDNNWHHLVFMSSSAGKYLYVDGELQASNASSASPSYDGGISNIGIRNTNLFMNGAVDDVAYFNRVLTPTEIKSIYKTPSANIFFTF